MQIKGNTILITGGGSGLGRGLAEAFHAEGNQVIVAGRPKEKLDETTAANPGMKAAVLDIGDADAIRAFAKQVEADYPALNVVIQNAGIMRDESLEDGSVSDAEATVATNLLGPIRLTAALIPLFKKQAESGRYHRLVRACICAQGNEPDLLRDQSRGAFLYSIFALSIEGYYRAGIGTDTALPPDRTAGRTAS